MREPREALAAARQAAAASPAPADEETRIDSGADRGRRLMRWAIIRPDLAEVYSTRRFGAPITWFKRLLIRFLGHYLDQVIAQQSRFNAEVAAHVIALEQRVRELESRAPASGPPHERS
jgi:hypothetical protein